jgi:hypothetical protein
LGDPLDVARGRRRNHCSQKIGIEQRTYSREIRISRRARAGERIRAADTLLIGNCFAESVNYADRSWPTRPAGVRIIVHAHRNRVKEALALVHGRQYAVHGRKREFRYDVEIAGEIICHSQHLLEIQWILNRNC